MVHQRVKDLIFYGIGIYSMVSYPVHRLRFKTRNNLYLQIGSGRNKKPGFINIDANPLAKPDLLYDVRARLPFKDESVCVIWSTHTLEHFYPDELFSILGESQRVLERGGTIRIVVPDLEKSIDAYLNKDHNYFIDVPRSFKSIGGQFVNFIFCDAQHKMAFDFDFMKEILTNTGFSDIKRLDYGISNIGEGIYKNLQPVEEQYRENSLFVEAIK